MSLFGKAIAAILCLASMTSIGISGAGAQEAQSKTAAPGESKSAKTRILEAGAKALQGSAPIDGFDIYLVGFHPLKEHPEQQAEAHHYCRQINEDLAQCVLFDGNTRSAKMNGVEYIISEKLFDTLPEDERQYWHPHNAEILSGQLMAPGIPGAAEKSLMKSKVNSYGKTWHFWNTGQEGQLADKLPMGKPMLAWSFNRDDEANPGLVERRDKKMEVNTAQRRKDRADLKELAKPQSGVDELKGKFGRQTRDIPGVVDKKAAGAAAGSKAPGQ